MSFVLQAIRQEGTEHTEQIRAAEFETTQERLLALSFLLWNRLKGYLDGAPRKSLRSPISGMPLSNTGLAPPKTCSSALL